MKIILDTDGTLTDFNKFINENAIKYFISKYDMKVVNPNSLEIEDIFNMKNFFMKKYNLSEEEAIKKVKKVVDKYWVGINFFKFSLMGKFRPGVREFINEKIKEGHQFEIHTSRAKTTEKNLIGLISREFTILQYRLNGIFISRKNFNFYENDNLKVQGIISTNPDLIFDDKVEILEQLSKKGLKTIGVRGIHNKYIEESNCIKLIDSFDKNEVENAIKNLVGTNNFKYYKRASKSDKFFRKLEIFSPIIKIAFKPIILNKQNIINCNNEAVVYAPNHRSTLDPIVITGFVVKNIHWAALLRFFQGKDSIFNNSKNPVLCKLTSQAFKKLEYFPIDRKSDNPNSNNFSSIRDMLNFLKINQSIGIFPEGTTRRAKGHDFGTFDDSFLLLAKSTDSWIQPITTLWIKDLGLPSKVILNFGEPFKVGDKNISNALEDFLKIQFKCLEENKKVAEELQKNNQKTFKNR